MTLGQLASHAALPRLRELLADANGSSEAFLALAIRRISADSDMATRLFAMSRRHDTPDPDACLAQLHTPEASARIRELQTSPNYLVAFAAQNVEDWYREA